MFVELVVALCLSILAIIIYRLYRRYLVIWRTQKGRIDLDDDQRPAFFVKFIKHATVEWALTHEDGLSLQLSKDDLCLSVSFVQSIVDDIWTITWEVNGLVVPDWFSLTYQCGDTTLLLDGYEAPLTVLDHFSYELSKIIKKHRKFPYGELKSCRFHGPTWRFETQTLEAAREQIDTYELFRIGASLVSICRTMTGNLPTTMVEFWRAVYASGHDHQYLAFAWLVEHDGYGADSEWLAMLDMVHASQALAMMRHLSPPVLDRVFHGDVDPQRRLQLLESCYLNDDIKHIRPLALRHAVPHLNNTWLSQLAASPDLHYALLVEFARSAEAATTIEQRDQLVRRSLRWFGVWGVELTSFLNIRFMKHIAKKVDVLHCVELFEIAARGDVANTRSFGHFVSLMMILEHNPTYLADEEWVILTIHLLVEADYGEAQQICTWFEAHGHHSVYRALTDSLESRDWSDTEALPAVESLLLRLARSDRSSGGISLVESDDGKLSVVAASGGVSLHEEDS